MASNFFNAQSKEQIPMTEHNPENPLLGREDKSEIEIMAAFLIEDYRRVLWEIHKRQEFRHTIYNAQILLCTAVIAATGAMLGNIITLEQNNIKPIENGFISFILILGSFGLSVLLSITTIQMNVHSIYIANAAKYIHNNWHRCFYKIIALNFREDFLKKNRSFNKTRK
jgi:hypothetical protein